MQLQDNERCDRVNDNITLIQKTDGLTFGTDALLLSAFIDSHHSVGAELGGGTGIISLLLASREKISTSTVFEIQEEYADLVRRNTDLNGLGTRLRAVCSDIRDLTVTEDCEIVYSNPPYMKTESGKSNLTEKKNVARHEVFGSISDFCIAARKLLKFGGRFFAVYRPDRLCDIVTAMRDNKLEPKRMTFVQGDVSATASMVLIEAKRGANPGMKLTPPLIIYKDLLHTEYSDDMNYIMDNGSFPKRFGKEGR